jgi:hypothetical protein
MKELRECPDVIYLQACDKCYAEYMDNAPEEVTWCEDSMSHICEDGVEEGTDVEYIRLDRLKEALKAIAFRRNDLYLQQSAGYDYRERITELRNAEDILKEYFPELKEDNDASI